MQVETERYLTKIRYSVEEIRNKEQLPKWQIDFEKYGGRENYEAVKKLYWERFDLGEQNTFGLLAEFRKDIQVKLDIPSKYDIYKQ